MIFNLSFYFFCKLVFTHIIDLKDFLDEPCSKILVNCSYSDLIIFIRSLIYRFNLKFGEWCSQKFCRFFIEWKSFNFQKILDLTFWQKGNIFKLEDHAMISIIFLRILVSKTVHKTYVVQNVSNLKSLNVVCNISFV